MSDQIEDPGNRKTLRLFEELTIRNAGKLKGALDELLGSSDCLLIDAASVAEIDLSCFQLLCAAHRTSIANEKPIVIEQGWPASIRQAAQAAGFSHNNGCRFNEGGRCLWK